MDAPCAVAKAFTSKTLTDRGRTPGSAPGRDSDVLVGVCTGGRRIMAGDDGEILFCWIGF